MQNSKIFTFLRKLSKKECDDFHKYLVQTKGDQHEWSRVFAYLKKFQPNYQDGQKLDVAYVCRVVFGKVWAERQNARRDMLNILSFLNGELKTFLLSERLKHTEDMKMLLWMEILRERGLTEELAKQTTLFYETTQKSDKTGLKSYFQEMAANFLQYQNLTTSAAYDDFYALRGFLEAWEAAAAVVHGKMVSDLASRTQVLAPKRDSMEITVPKDNIPVHAEKSRLNTYPYAQLCHEAREMIETGKEEHFTRLETLFFGCAHTLEKEEARWFAKCLKNYIAKKVRGSEHAYLAPKLHALDKLGWDMGLFSGATDLNPTEFSNVVTAACAYKDLDWAKDFIQKYGGVLPEENRETALTLANATLAMEMKEYPKVLDLIASQKFEDWRDHIRSKILLLRACFEMNSEDHDLHGMCANFERQMNKNGHPESEATKAAQGFLSIFKLLLKENVTPKKLSEQIEKTEHLYLRDWFRQKAQTYKGRFAKNKN